MARQLAKQDAELAATTQYTKAEAMRALFALSLAFLLTATSAAIAQDAIPWARSIEEAQQIAAQQQRLVLVHFYGDNCPPCKALEANVFPKQDFARAVTAHYVPVKINGSQNRKLVAKYGITRWPTDIVLTADGKVISGPMTCPPQAATYQATLDRIATQHFASQKPANVAVAQNVAYDQPMGEQSRYGAQPVKQAAPTGAPVNARDPRVAQQPQQQQPRYEAPPTDAYQPDLKSSFVPPGGNGGAYVGGQPYREPQSGLPPRGQGQYGQGQYGSPLATEGDPSVAVRPKQSQTDDPMYGSNANQQPSYSAYRGGNVGNVEQKGYDPRYVGGLAPNTSARNEPAPQPGYQQNPNVSVAPPRGNVEAPPARDAAPASASPMCLEGYCPVALLETGKWVKGDVRFGAIHRGRTYLFTAQASQQKFLANPDKFSPMLSGFDPVKFIEQGELVDGNRKFGTVYKEHMYLFADEAAMLRFERQPDSYNAPVQQAMQQAGPTRR
jgi:YHS domain-containing protein/thiol-disulfide isomerase/thioredoxin